MIWQTPTGKQIVATAEMVPATCGITFNADGTWDYDGTGANMLWDSQYQRTYEGEKLFVCEDGHLWRECSLIKNPVAKEDEDA